MFVFHTIKTVHIYNNFSFLFSRFSDVLQTIKEHAFVASEYPLILSIENHCSLLQQRKMATLFQEVFKEMLVVQPVERDAREMPSPQQLRKKIIIKVTQFGFGCDFFENS